jgi:hypothetical protein
VHTASNHTLQNPAIALRLQSTRPVGRVAELGSLDRMPSFEEVFCPQTAAPRPVGRSGRKRGRVYTFDVLSQPKPGKRRVARGPNLPIACGGRGYLGSAKAPRNDDSPSRPLGLESQNFRSVGTYLDRPVSHSSGRRLGRARCPISPLSSLRPSVLPSSWRLWRLRFVRTLFRSGGCRYPRAGSLPADRSLPTARPQVS